MVMMKVLELVLLRSYLRQDCFASIMFSTLRRLWVMALAWNYNLWSFKSLRRVTINLSILTIFTMTPTNLW